MQRPLTEEEEATLKRLWAQYLSATVQAYDAIRVKGIGSEDFAKADAAAGDALQEIKAALIETGQQWMT